MPVDAQPTGGGGYPSAPLPTSLVYGTVSWTAVGIAEDDLDADALPNAESINGWITITAFPSKIVKTSPDAVTVLPRPKRYRIAGGRMVDAQGRTVISLVGNNSPGTTPQDWSYHAEWALDDGYSFGAFDFLLPGAQHVDLSDAQPLSAAEPGTNPIGPVTSVVGVSGAVTGTQIAADPAVRAAYPSRPSVLLDAKSLATLVGDGVADETVAVQEAINDAAALYSTWGGRGVTLLFPRGTYRVGHLTVPGGVSICGEGSGVTRFVNTATDGGVFVQFRGSFSRTWDMTYDGQRAAQLAQGLAAVQFSRPNNPTAGADIIAGGVVLTAAPAAGATSLAVDTASPGGEAIRAGEIITLKEGDLLATPAGVTVTPTGTVGTTTYGYRVSALNSAGETLASATVQTTTGNAILSATNYNAVSWTAVTGAASYNVYGRTAGSELFIANVATTSYSDSGAATPAGALPAANTTTKYEMARVAHTYSGGTTIPLASALANAFTVAAKVSIASTDVGIHDCTVFANDRDGIAFWHVIYGFARFNRVRDASDTGIDIPDAGCRFVDVHGNDIETNGRWGVAVDTVATQYGRTADCPVSDNIIRFLPGGGADQRDGIYIGQVDRCPMRGNTVDLSLAGISGIHYAGTVVSSPASDTTVIGNATPRAGTYGIRASANNLAGLFVRGGSIAGVARGVDLNTVWTGGVIGVEINNVSDFGVNVLADAAIIQAVTVLNVVANGNVAAVRFGGTPNAGSRGVVNGCILTASSFSKVTADAGWTVTETNNIP